MNTAMNEKRNENIGVIMNDLQYIKRDISEIKHKLEANYVTKEEFDPIKRIVYGMVSIILVAVVTAIVALVLR